METNHVAGLAGRSGDPSPVTAHGVFRAIQGVGQGAVGQGFARTARRSRCRAAATSATTSTKELQGRRREAHRHATSTPERVKRVVEEFGARARVAPTRSTACRPTSSRRARSARSSTTRRFRSSRWRSSPAPRTTSCVEERHGDELEKRNILYAPDYVINAGGVINVYSELAGWTIGALDPQGATRSTTRSSRCSRSRSPKRFRRTSRRIAWPSSGFAPWAR